MTRSYVGLAAISLTFLGCKLSTTAALKTEATDGSQNIDTAALFKDDMDFNMEDVKKGKVCGSVKNDKIQFKYHAWPSDMKGLLARELSRFDYIKMTAPYVEGIYLVDFTPDMALGMTCHDAKADKYVIFINTTVVLRSRDTSHIDVASYAFDGRPQGIPALESRGDGAVQTTLHEFFHVMDFAYYWDDFLSLMTGKTPKDARKAADRRHFFEQSWDASTGDSLFKGVLPSERANPPTGDAGGVAGLVDTKAKIPAGGVFVARDHIEEAMARQSMKPLGLAASDPALDVKAFESRLQAIADKTNFVSDYATDNFMEDFAVTLEQYYLGTRYAMWERYEFFAPLQPYVFTAKDLLSHESPQRRKTCELVKFVFQESCR